MSVWWGGCVEGWLCGGVAVWRDDCVWRGGVVWTGSVVWRDGCVEGWRYVEGQLCGGVALCGGMAVWRGGVMWNDGCVEGWLCVVGWLCVEGWHQQGQTTRHGICLILGHCSLQVWCCLGGGGIVFQTKKHLVVNSGKLEKEKKVIWKPQDNAFLFSLHFLQVSDADAKPARRAAASGGHLGFWLCKCCQVRHLASCCEGLSMAQLPWFRNSVPCPTCLRSSLEILNQHSYCKSSFNF